MAHQCQELRWSDPRSPRTPLQTGAVSFRSFLLTFILILPIILRPPPSTRFFFRKVEVLLMLSNSHRMASTNSLKPSASRTRKGVHRFLLSSLEGNVLLTDRRANILKRSRVPWTWSKSLEVHDVAKRRAGPVAQTFSHWICSHIPANLPCWDVMILLRRHRSPQGRSAPRGKGSGSCHPEVQKDSRQSPVRYPGEAKPGGASAAPEKEVVGPQGSRG